MMANKSSEIAWNLHCGQQTQVGIFCLANSQRLHFLRHCKCQQISATAARQNHKAVLARLTTVRVEPSRAVSTSVYQSVNAATGKQNKCNG